jgi:two-component system cell cycle response regulator
MMVFSTDDARVGSNSVKVLIIERDVKPAQMLSGMLEQLGYEVVRASEAAAAWELHQKEHFSIVISSRLAPGMDGIKFYRRLRNAQESDYTYLFLLTDRDHHTDLLEELKAGADDYLVNPLDLSELAPRLEVARRVLAREAEQRRRTGQIEEMNAELAQQNENLAEALTFMKIASRRFTELFDGLPVACYSYDEKGCIHEWNRAAVELFGYRSHEVMERPLWDVFRSDDEDGQQQNIRRQQETVRRIFNGESLVGIELQLRGKEGRMLSVLCNTFPIRLTDGSITGAISANIDITLRKELERQVESQLLLANELNARLAKANQRLSDLATTDGLTGLKNHRHFRETLDKCFAFAMRHGIPLSIALLDVDWFKSFNDTYGHPAGDDVLRTIAAVLEGCVREQDLVARYGGEEFVVLMPGTDAPGALKASERLREAVERYQWPLRSVTASFGTATTTPETRTASNLVDEADRALYASKQQGRNRVTHFDERTSLADCTLNFKG